MAAANRGGDHGDVREAMAAANRGGDDGDVREALAAQIAEKSATSKSSVKR
jgi:hypothetical protein